MGENALGEPRVQSDRCYLHTREKSTFDRWDNWWLGGFFFGGKCGRLVESCEIELIWEVGRVLFLGNLSR